MRKLLFLTALFISLNSNAQDYHITFAGTGSSSAVGSVIVENLTSGLSLTLNGSDILYLTGTVGITAVENMQLSSIKIYPNPLTENSLMEFFPPSPGDATISVYDMTGKPVAHIRGYLENTRQVFRLSGIKSGLYLVNIEGKSYRLSGKLLSTISEGSKISIERIGSNQAPEEKEYINDAKGSAGTVDMAYSEGDRLKFTGVSGDFSTVKTDIPTEDKTITFNFMPCTDGDNNHYPVVEIGTQVWMTENLKTTKYNNNTDIPLVTDNNTWVNLTTPAYCWYNQDEATNKNIYGALYNWYAASSGKICPTGWHVLSEVDYMVLVSLLGGTSTAGGKMKETGTTHWQEPNTGATNETGFTGLPGGRRRYDALFVSMGSLGYYWSSSEDWEAGYALMGILHYNSTKLETDGYSLTNGMSVRCVKD
jgi:uncharacterized protein (TIGR02145 family)